MSRFETLRIEDARRERAPDGSEVHVLLRLAGGGMARFTLPPGAISAAVRHRSVEEIWFVMTGSGSMWREAAGFEEVTGLRPGTCIAIPAGTAFQFRADTGAEDLVAVAVTMPPWPGPGEASPAEGPWKPTAGP